MCEFKIKLVEPGKEESLAAEDISYLQLQDDGSLLLKGLGIRENVDSAIISEINVYSEEGGVIRLFKVPIIGDFIRFLKKIETGASDPEMDEIWNDFVAKGNELLNQIKRK